MATRRCEEDQREAALWPQWPPAAPAPSGTPPAAEQVSSASLATALLPRPWSTDEFAHWPEPGCPTGVSATDETARALQLVLPTHQIGKVLETAYQRSAESLADWQGGQAG